MDTSKFRLIEASAWKTQLVGEQRAEADLGLWKYATVVRSPAEAKVEDRELEFVISDGGVDRDRDTIALKGWDLKHYQKNPVVLWAHQSQGLPPVATARKVWRDSSADQLLAVAKFLPPEMADHDHVRFSEMLFEMYLGGFMRATSVGFLPSKFEWAPETDDQGNDRRGGIDFLKQELLEFSLVPIPANPRALLRRDYGNWADYETWIMRAHEQGFDTKPFKAWAERMLDEKIGGLGRNDLERAWSRMAESPIVVEVSGWEPEEDKTTELDLGDQEETLPQSNGGDPNPGDAKTADNSTVLEDGKLLSDPPVPADLSSEEIDSLLPAMAQIAALCDAMGQEATAKDLLKILKWLRAAKIFPKRMSAEDVDDMEYYREFSPRSEKLEETQPKEGDEREVLNVEGSLDDLRAFVRELVLEHLGSSR